VDLGYGLPGKGLRVSRDGQTQQVEWNDGTWHIAVDYYSAVDGYRKGRDVALEQVQELVEAVEAVEIWLGKRAPGDHKVLVDGVMWEDIRAAAKAVKG